MNSIKVSLITAVLSIVSFGVINAQDNVTDVSPGDRLQAFSQPSNSTQEIVEVGSLRFYSDETEFNEVCSGLSLEDFEDTNAPPNSSVGCPEPLNSQSDDACYSPGALIPGFSITTRNSTSPGSEIVTVTPPFLGAIDVAVGANTLFDDTIITFTDVVNSAGLLLVGILGDTTVEVEVYGINNTLLGSTIVDVVGANGTFIGIESTLSLIERIELIETGESNAELLYDLSFGLCNFSNTRPIPTLSEWGLIAMAGILGLAGFIAVRKRALNA